MQILLLSASLVMQIFLKIDFWWSYFVALIIAGQIWQDTGCASDNIGIGTWQSVNETLQEIFQAVDFGSGVGQVSHSPQTVLNQSSTRVSEVHGQGLHASGVHDCWLVTRANRENWK